MTFLNKHVTLHKLRLLMSQAFTVRQRSISVSHACNPKYGLIIIIPVIQEQYLHRGDLYEIT